MSVTSSGRSSTSSTIRCTSGLFASIEWAICFIMVVLPAFGGETIIPRCPLPIGESRSTIRAVRFSLSPGVSRCSRSSGKSGVRSSNRGRPRAASGSRPETVSIAAGRGTSRCCRAGRQTPSMLSPLAQGEPTGLADRDVDVLRRRAGTRRTGGTRSPRRADREGRGPGPARPGTALLVAPRPGARARPATRAVAAPAAPAAAVAQSSLPPPWFRLFRLPWLFWLRLFWLRLPWRLVARSLPAGRRPPVRRRSSWRLTARAGLRSSAGDGRLPWPSCGRIARVPRLDQIPSSRPAVGGGERRRSGRR